MHAYIIFGSTLFNSAVGFIFSWLCVKYYGSESFSAYTIAFKYAAISATFSLVILRYESIGIRLINKLKKFVFFTFLVVLSCCLCLYADLGIYDSLMASIITIYSIYFIFVQENLISSGSLRFLFIFPALRLIVTIMLLVAVQHFYLNFDFLFIVFISSLVEMAASILLVKPIYSPVSVNETIPDNLKFLVMYGFYGLFIQSYIVYSISKFGGNSTSALLLALQFVGVYSQLGSGINSYSLRTGESYKLVKLDVYYLILGVVISIFLFVLYTTFVERFFSIDAPSYLNSSVSIVVLYFLSRFLYNKCANFLVPTSKRIQLLYVGITEISICFFNFANIITWNAAYIMMSLLLIAFSITKLQNSAN